MVGGRGVGRMEEGRKEGRKGLETDFMDDSDCDLWGNCSHSHEDVGSWITDHGSRTLILKIRGQTSYVRLGWERCCHILWQWAGWFEYSVRGAVSEFSDNGKREIYSAHSGL